ncbi:MAG: helix-turn-helix domain-containing protein [Pirellulales bacterium]
MSDFSRWLLAQLRFVDHIDSHPEPSFQHVEELRQIIDEAQRRAAGDGLPNAVEACQIRQGPISPEYARKILAACLGEAEAGEGASQDAPCATLTVPEVAQDLQVARDKVYDWIRSGRLVATNVNKPGARPSYRVTPEALADFKAKGKPTKPEAKPRGGRSPNVTEFF